MFSNYLQLEDKRGKETKGGQCLTIHESRWREHRRSLGYDFKFPVAWRLKLKRQRRPPGKSYKVPRPWEVVWRSDVWTHSNSSSMDCVIWGKGSHPDAVSSSVQQGFCEDERRLHVSIYTPPVTIPTHWALKKTEEQTDGSHWALDEVTELLK